MVNYQFSNVEMFDFQKCVKGWKFYFKKTGIVPPSAVNYVTNESDAHEDKETHHSTKHNC